MALPNQQIADNPSFKIPILGAPGTAGAEYLVDFPSNLGGIRFICSDKDKELFRRALNWREFIILEKKIRCALEGSHGSIIMLDENSPTYSEVPELIRKIRRFCGNIPIVLCRNRVDLRHIVNARQLMQLPGNIKYCEISEPSNYNIERPFLLLAMMLVSPSISFIEEMAHLVPAEDMIDLQAQDTAEVMIDLQAQDRNERAHERAFYIQIFEPMAWRVLKEHRNLDPDSPLPDHDDELMWMVKVMMEKSI